MARTVFTVRPKYFRHFQFNRTTLAKVVTLRPIAQAVVVPFEIKNRAPGRRMFRRAAVCAGEKRLSPRPFGVQSWR